MKQLPRDNELFVVQGIEGELFRSPADNGFRSPIASEPQHVRGRVIKRHQHAYALTKRRRCEFLYVFPRFRILMVDAVDGEYEPWAMRQLGHSRQPSSRFGERNGPS